MIVDNILRDLATKVASYRAQANNRDLDNFSLFKKRAETFFFASFEDRINQYFADAVVKDMKFFTKENEDETKTFYINFIAEEELYRRNLPFYSISVMMAVSGQVDSVNVLFPALGELYSTNFSGGIILNNKRVNRENYKDSLLVSKRDFFSGSISYDLCKLMTGHLDICEFEVNANVCLLPAVLLAMECGFIIANADKKVISPNDFLFNDRVIIGKGSAIDKYFNA